MLRKCVFVLFGAFCSIQLLADTLQLKDKASVTGKILAEKRDQVAVDVGYTVLVIPRNQVVKIIKGGDTAAKTTGPEFSTPPAPPADEEPTPTASAEPKVEPAPKPQSNADSPAFYNGSGKNAAPKSVRELVNLLGEAVVQVRTPSGLGSGFTAIARSVRTTSRDTNCGFRNLESRRTPSLTRAQAIT